MNSATLTYEAALEKAMSLADFERSTHSPGHSGFHLERISLLAERLGNPHLDVPVVHVAGTKGKGSTSAMITSILAAERLKVGLQTSPHLHSATERIRVGMEPISKAEFAALVQQVWPAVEEVGRNGGYGGVSFFELVTAMSFLHFKQIGADFQVQEVGLGGRLDSTNIVQPEVSVITSISLDHVATLGDTIPKIAFEKAGIIKRGKPVVVAPQTEEAMAVFREVAEQRQSPLIAVQDRMSWRHPHSIDMERGTGGEVGQSFEVRGLRGTYEVWTPLLGDYQQENAATAIAAVETLVDRGFAISKESILQGLRDVKWPARLEVFHKDGRLIVVDGAHNPYSMMRLVQAVRQGFRFDRVFLIFGALGGHSAKGMIEELVAISPKVIVTHSRHPRSSPGAAIAALVSEQGLPIAFSSENVGEATRKAIELAGENDLVLATGSLSVAAEVIEEIKGIPPEVYPTLKPPPNIGAQRVG